MSANRTLIGGGTDGNEILTNLAGAVLLALLAVIGLTILRLGQLISVHLFVGLLLLGPVAVKMGSTGYRFVRYYTRNPAYRQKGAPELGLRLIAPIIVTSTIVVFVSGLLLLFGGPRTRDQDLELHKVSFIVWIVFTGVHVVAHLPSMMRSLRSGLEHRHSAGAAPGVAGRWLTIAGALVGGGVLALVLIPDFAPWTAHGTLLHHHHH